MKKLSGREELFCRLYASCRNSREAAFKAGYTFCPEIASKKLLAKPDIRKAIEQIEKENTFSDEEVRAGLRRIAFASSADAVRLLLSDNYEDIDAEALDLFNISEIKRAKGGGIEIKFFDRIKALEKLGEFSGSIRSDNAEPFYAALEKSAKAMNGGDSD